MPPLALPLERRACKDLPRLPGNGPAIPGKPQVHLIAVIVLQAVEHGPALVLRLDRAVNRKLAREQIQKTRLYGISFLAAVYLQLHGASRRA